MSGLSLTGKIAIMSLAIPVGITVLGIAGAAWALGEGAQFVWDKMNGNRDEYTSLEL